MSSPYRELGAAVALHFERRATIARGILLIWIGTLGVLFSSKAAVSVGGIPPSASSFTCGQVDYHWRGALPRTDASDGTGNENC